MYLKIKSNQFRQGNRKIVIWLVADLSLVMSTEDIESAQKEKKNDIKLCYPKSYKHGMTNEEIIKVASNIIPEILSENEGTK